MIAQGQRTIVDLNDPIQQGTAPAAPVTGMLWLNTAEAPPQLYRYNGAGWDQINEVDVGGVNLITGSAGHTVADTDGNTYWIAADELTPGQDYTFSVHQVRLDAGTATKTSWALANQDTGSNAMTGTLNVSDEKQVFRFTVPDTDGNWSLYLFCGLMLQTDGNTVTYVKSKLEEGCIPTTWSPAPEDTTSQIEQLLGSIDGLDSTLETRVLALIESMGLSDQFASAEEFLKALEDIELIRSELAQTDSDLTLTFTRLTAAENSLTQMYSYFEMGDDNGTPYLDMGSSASSVKMRLTNTRLAFVQAGAELAYFSDNKLYVERLEAQEQISIGTASNGFLDIVTTATGVGLKWRS